MRPLSPIFSPEVLCPESQSIAKLSWKWLYVQVAIDVDLATLAVIDSVVYRQD